MNELQNSPGFYSPGHYSPDITLQQKIIPEQNSPGTNISRENTLQHKIYPVLYSPKTKKDITLQVQYSPGKKFSGDKTLQDIIAPGTKFSGYKTLQVQNPPSTKLSQFQLQPKCTRYITLQYLKLTKLHKDQNSLPFGMNRHKAHGTKLSRFQKMDKLSKWYKILPFCLKMAK